MTATIAAIALLCGIPLGIIIGLVLGYAAFTREVNHAEPGTQPEDWGV